VCVPSALKVTEVPCPPSTKSPVSGVLPAGVVARWQVLGAGPDDLERPVLALAWSAAELLTDDVRARVRVCPGTGYGWLFLDTSGRRRWCDLQWCGNRARPAPTPSGRRRHRRPDGIR